MAVCPVDCFYRTDEGVVLHDKDVCIGCGYCSYACPFGAPQFRRKAPSACAARWTKCTFCAGGPEEDGSQAEFEKYGRNRPAEGKLPLCAEMCSTKGRCWRATPPKWPTSSASGWSVVAAAAPTPAAGNTAYGKGSMDADMKAAETGGAK